MRHLFAIAAAAALVGAPVQAAESQAGAGEVRSGAFVGARLRLRLGGSVAAKPEAALALAGTQSYRSTSGRTVNLMSEGVALDLAGRKPALTLGGVPVHAALRLHQQGDVALGPKLGISTGGWIAIGAVLAVATVVAITQFTCVGEDEEHCGSQ
jgi:hypothetical protein